MVSTVEDTETYPLTTREGWRAFVDADTDVPTLSPASASADQKAADDQARLDYHARLVVVATPTIRQVFAAGRRLILLNRHQISARRGLVVAGATGTGKTTAITQLGRNHELLQRQRLGTDPGRLPVVYVTVPPAATPKMLAIEFARFLALPASPRESQTSITNMVCDVLCRLRTELVLVDEIHNIRLATRIGAEASDQLKYLGERIPATFVYSGLGVDGLFSGLRGQQLAGRFGLLESLPFPYGTAPQRSQWQALVATLDDAIRLHRHRTGSLLQHDQYLHQRTRGMIGSLSHLIRGAAMEAILDGTEKITRKTLAGIQLDNAAETAPMPTPSRRAR